MPPLRNLTFDVYCCSVPIDRVKLRYKRTVVAVRRGPLDPVVPPEHAYLLLGTYLAASEAEALAEARADKQTRPRIVHARKGEIA